jgi:hypothetical protein
MTFSSTSWSTSLGYYMTLMRLILLEIARLIWLAQQETLCPEDGGLPKICASGLSIC